MCSRVFRSRAGNAGGRMGRSSSENMLHTDSVFSRSLSYVSTRKSYSISSRGAEHRQRGAALAGLEGHRHRLADPDGVEVAVDDVGHHRQAFLERDLGERVGVGQASYQAVRIHGAATL